ncbi:MAG TPA: hypothetical protein DCL77_04125, partial [Prolixibacteraceae bacterium]|nr:hypothetical protein [Prolixibacteraceae bacterium]
RIPFIRISSLFLMGILCNHYLQIDPSWVAIVLSLLISVLILLWHNNHFSGLKIQNILVSLAILLSGLFYPFKDFEQHSPAFDQKDYFLAEVCQKPIEKERTYQSILRIQNKLMPNPEKVMAYFSKESFDTTLIAGDQMILLVQPTEIKNRGYAFEFDYRKMMHNKGIDFSVYLTSGTYQKTGIKIHRISYWAEQVRDKLLVLLASSKIEKEERAVVSALTLGYRAELDPDTLSYFVNTGTIHVLSVSGLHVALIFFILSFLFSGINKGKFGTIIYPLLVLFLLWFYAFITGFSPPVQRSTVMFTFVIIGRMLRRPVNIYNSLSASALVLIVLDPNVLFDVGFQLSYLAIFGIVLVQPPLQSLMEVKNKMLRWAWTLFTVSLAAQLITFPLSILYFNQFPNFFWLSNYFAIPGTTLLMWLTFCFFILSPIPLISFFLARLIQWTTHLLLSVLKWMGELPHAVSHGIVYTTPQALLIYGLIAAFIIYGFSKNKTGLFGGLVFLILFQTSLLWTKFSLFNQKSVYVYNYKNTLIQLVNGRNSYILSLGKNQISIREINNIQNVCNHLKLEKVKLLNLKTKDELNTTDLKINGKTLQFLNCRLNLTYQIMFHIQGSDSLKFRIHNPELSKKKITNTILPVQYASLNGKMAFSINFTTPIKEAICVNLE